MTNTAAKLSDKSSGIENKTDNTGVDSLVNEVR
jgi:hypothetical protein